MSEQFPNSFSQKFAPDIHIQFQQNGSRIRGKVDERSITPGETLWLPQIAPVTNTTAYVRHGPTQFVDTIHSTRKLTTAPTYWADRIDTPDMKRTNASFMGSYVKQASMKFGRDWDTLCQTTALGTNYAKLDGALTESAVTLPSTQIVDADFGGATIGQTLAKFVEAKSILGKNETPEGETLYYIMRQEQIDDLLNNIDQSNNADYTAVRSLDQGGRTSWMGFQFIKTQTVAYSAGDIASCIAYTKSAIVAANTESFNAKVEQDMNSNYLWQAWASHDIGFTRIQEEGVVEVLCDQSP